MWCREHDASNTNNILIRRSHVRQVTRSGAGCPPVPRKKAGTKKTVVVTKNTAKSPPVDPLIYCNRMPYCFIGVHGATSVCCIISGEFGTRKMSSSTSSQAVVPLSQARQLECALSVAAECGDLAALKKLLASGMPIETKNEVGCGVTAVTECPISCAVLQ